MRLPAQSFRKSSALSAANPSAGRQMLSPREVASFAAVCGQIGNELANESGFVAIRDLLDRFHAEIRIRPLLVEGMLASIENKGSGAESTHHWAVLIDSETYPVTEADIARESTTRPLPARLRNTVAHELVHSLALRPTEFGIKLPMGEGAEGKYDLVRSIEQVTESLSPLLLLPEKALSNLLRGRSTQVTVGELDALREELAISRPLLISRLAQLSPNSSDGMRDLPALRNIGIGIGEWTRDGTAVLRSWPLYINFDNNIAPAVFRKLRHQDRISAPSVFPDNSFALSGGVECTAQFVSDAGLLDNPASEKFPVVCAISKTRKTIGSSFLYVMQRPGSVGSGSSLEEIRKKFGKPHCRDR
jgi:hypothetical protein